MQAILSLGHTTYELQVGVVGLLLGVWAIGSAWEALRARRA